MKTRIYFRADGHNQMGLGHVIRSLALADCLKNDFDCRFIIRNPSEAIRNLIKKTCTEIYELSEVLPFEKEAEYLAKTIFNSNEILVLDGYHFDSDYQKQLKSHVGKMVCIDDIHSTHFFVDVIINHAAGVTENDYSAEPETKFCLGFDYLLLREPFLKAATDKKRVRDNQNFFICLGGADPKNDTMQVLKKAMAEMPDGHFFVVVGSAYQHEEELKDFQKNTGNITVLKNLTAEQMVETMKFCRTAITSPSTVSLEYLAIGGNLYLKQIADNQTRIFKFLTQKQLAFDFEKFGKIDSVCENVRIANQEAFIDGNSQKRLTGIFKELSLELHSRLRHATEYDVTDYFELANDPGTRRASFSKEKIRLFDHVKWFYKKLKEQNTQMYLLEYDGKFAGQIRFDIDEKATVSYSIAPRFRGKGLGKCLLKKGIEKLRKEVDSEIEIEGIVKKENAASNRIFQALGFHQTESKRLPNAVRYFSKAELPAA